MAETDIVEEVDLNDNLTGRTFTKGDAHDQKILHRCVAVYVFDQDGDLYVQEHIKSDRRLDHTVGGHVDEGEDYETAAYREMEEEIGLSGVKLTEIAVGHSSQEGAYHVYGIYMCVAPEDWEFVPSEEVDVLRKMKIENITLDMKKYGREKFTGGFLSTMQKYLEVTRAR